MAANTGFTMLLERSAILQEMTYMVCTFTDIESFNYSQIVYVVV